MTYREASIVLTAAINMRRINTNIPIESLFFLHQVLFV